MESNKFSTLIKISVQFPVPTNTTPHQNPLKGKNKKTQSIYDEAGNLNSNQYILNFYHSFN
jgi:hypothetical protein